MGCIVPLDSKTSVRVGVMTSEGACALLLTRQLSLQQLALPIPPLCHER